VVQPDDALRALADDLRAERSVIAASVHDPQTAPALGELAAAGPRAAGQEGEYALVVESVREGYLLHYGTPRIVAPDDRDLALLAGDYLYALGLERLAALADMEAVRELSDLISLSAQVHAEDRGKTLAGALWLASVIAVGCGARPAHEEAKAALRAGGAEAGDLLVAAARQRAADAGITAALETASEAIHLPSRSHG
jgi:hypothetical protein